jgi:hypothetical protein
MRRLTTTVQHKANFHQPSQSKLVASSLANTRSLRTAFGQATGYPSLVIQLAQVLQRSSPLLAAASSEGTAARKKTKRPVVAEKLIAVVAATASDDRLQE